MVVVNKLSKDSTLDQYLYIAVEYLKNIYALCIVINLLLHGFTQNSVMMSKLLQFFVSFAFVRV